MGSHDSQRRRKRCTLRTRVSFASRSSRRNCGSTHTVTSLGRCLCATAEAALHLICRKPRTSKQCHWGVTDLQPADPRILCKNSNDVVGHRGSGVNDRPAPQVASTDGCQIHHCGMAGKNIGSLEQTPEQTAENQWQPMHICC